ncbi:MAG: helix-turn-helix domain-containing protein [Chloroflexi bacterium]|nr:helix-turn-helix domain-containing protein [Chloroflexota bacterium]
MGELGEMLRKAREAKGLSLEQVEEATKIVRSYLQALEDEEFERLPAPVYVKGFLKNYASYLGLDPQDVLSLYTASTTPISPTPTMTMLDEPLVPSVQTSWWPLALALLVVALGIAGWWGYQRYYGRAPFTWAWPFARVTATPTPTAVPPTPTPTVLPPTPTATLAPTFTATHTPTPKPTPVGLELSIEIVGQRSWLLVQADEERVFVGILEPGAKYTWTARERIILRSGWAGAVQVTLNGQPLGLLGGPGEVVEKEWTAPGVPTRTPVPTATP